MNTNTARSTPKSGGRSPKAGGGDRKGKGGLLLVDEEELEDVNQSENNLNQNEIPGLVESNESDELEDL